MISRKIGFPTFLFVGLLALAALFVVACGGAQATATPAPTATAVIATTPTATALPVATATRAATATATPVKGPAYGGTIRFGHLFHIDTLDPAYNALGGGYQPNFAIYDQLLTIDAEANLLPALAKSWEISPDGKVVTFKLATGVKFHDGTPFNADAVKWNMDRIMDAKNTSPRRAEIQPYVEKVEVVDDATVKMTMFFPFRPLLPLLGSDRPGFLVSPAAVQKFGGGPGGNYGRNPVGTGPFIFKEWIPSDHVTLVKNANYWQSGKPYLDTILIQGVPDPSVRIAMLRTDETDIIYSLDVKGSDIPLIERNPDLKILRRDGTSSYMLQFNAGKSPFTNKALRQAIAYSMNRDNFVKAVLGGVGTPGYIFIPSGWAYNPNIKPVEYDVNKVKSKLAEAGFPNGATVPMGCPTSGIYLDMCEYAIAMMDAVGIKTNVIALPTNDYFGLGDTGFRKAAGFGATQIAFRVDPTTRIQPYVHSKGANNADGYKNTEVDNLIDQAVTLYDTAKAKVLYDQIQTIIAEDAVFISLARGTALFPMNKRVQGFVPYPTVFEHLETTWIEK